MARTKGVQFDFEPRKLIDPIGYKNFIGIAQRLRSDWDWVNITVGPERSGKTTFGHIICAIADPSYSLTRVVFPTTELRYAIMKAKPYQAVNQDEGAETWLSIESTGRDARDIQRLFMQVGARNLFFNINIPDVRMVQKYLKTFRARSMIRIKKRGHYEYFSRRRIREIRVDSVTKAIKWPSPSYRGRFGRIPTSSAFWQGYLEKKMLHIGNTGRENPKVITAQLKLEDAIKNTIPFRIAADMAQTNVQLIHRWDNNGTLKRLGVKIIQTGTGKRVYVKDVRRIIQRVWGKDIDNSSRR